MHLNNQTKFPAETGIAPVNFDRLAVIERTKSEPTWVHFGAGNIFRAYLARACHELIEQGDYDKGVIAAEGYDYEIVDKSLTPFDNLLILVTLKSDGTVDKKVVASITEALKADPEHDNFNRLKDIFRNPSLQMASFTITEKGYSLQTPSGDTPPDIAYDFEHGAESPKSYMGKVAALVYERYKSTADTAAGGYARGGTPLALVSMDNCSHNGDKLKAAVKAFVEQWCKRGLVDNGFADYINEKVSFPWSMIDKITPAPHADVRKLLEVDGFEDMETIVTSKNTHTAPFVNAEQTEYLVIEDDFPNDRPPLEKSRANIIFTDRETVDKAERMKVCTCLNPLHTALAVFGCLLGYNKISEEMKDPDLKRLVEKIGYDEGLPSVINPKIINPERFIDEVISIRLPNPFLPDAPQRIATDTSQKLPIRFGETIKAYTARDDLNVADLKLIPLVFAGWLRYLMGLDDDGNTMEVSPDPLYKSLYEHVKQVRLCQPDEDYTKHIRPILEDCRIFGVNLYEAGLGKTVEGMFAELIADKGAVRSVLRKYLY